MNPDCTHLDWRPVLLVKVLRQPFGGLYDGLSVKRMYLTEHTSGVLSADWTLPADERRFPLVQYTGWQPDRDVPFELPVKFQRNPSCAALTLIPSGAWVLPYSDDLYQLYEQAQAALHLTLQQVVLAPPDPHTQQLLRRWIE